mmetsp:Transcript_45371/g.73075  ORF Transcript_45371/g.73075 Transcript_45371/m.73075 type:complete len:88 (+) Transcript_45371:11-274(+)
MGVNGPDIYLCMKVYVYACTCVKYACTDVNAQTYMYVNASVPLPAIREWKCTDKHIRTRICIYNRESSKVSSVSLEMVWQCVACVAV